MGNKVPNNVDDSYKSDMATLNSLPDSFLIILCGLPSSGKSTFALELQKRLNASNRNTIIIDNDEVRIQLYGKEFNPKNERLVRDNVISQISDVLLEKNTIVINDDINYFAGMRHELKEISRKLDLSYFLIHISTPLDICLKWNSTRLNKVEDDVIIRISDKFDIPGKKYSWDESFFNFNFAKDALNEAVESTICKIVEHFNVVSNTIKKSKSEEIVISNKERVDKITRNFLNYYAALISDTVFLETEVLKHELREYHEIFERNPLLSERLLSIKSVFNANLNELNKKRRDYLLKHDFEKIDSRNIEEILIHFLSRIIS